MLKAEPRMSAGLSVWPLSVFTPTQTLSLPDGREMLREKFTRDLVLRRTRIIHSDVSSTPPINFAFTFAIMSSPARRSVCRLSVTFMHPTQVIEIFGNVSTPFGTLAIC